jgi:hypothetical protein
LLGAAGLEMIRAAVGELADLLALLAQLVEVDQLGIN